MSIARLKYLSEEIHDLIDVSYVLNLILDQIEKNMEKSDCATNTTDIGPSIEERAPSADVMSSSKLYDNSHLIYDTYIIRPNELLPPYPDSFLEGQSQADSLEEFLRLEEHFEQNPASTGEELVQQAAEPMEEQTATEPVTEMPVPAPRSPRKESEIELKKMLEEVLIEQEQRLNAQKGDAMSKSMTEHSEVNKERAERGQSLGSQSLLMRLEHENEQLAEQAEVLEKMNERLTKKIRDLEEKETAREQSKETEKDAELKDQMEKLTTRMEEMTKLVREKEEEIEKLENEKDRAEKECELRGKMIDELKAQNEQNNDTKENTSRKLEELDQESKQKASTIESLQAMLREQESEIPDVSKVGDKLKDIPHYQVEIIKSYLHSELEKRVVQLISETFIERKLQGDAATRHISTAFNLMYGEHWQVFLFREHGHGCQIYHNNNCFILLRLGSYLLALFKH